MLDPYEVLGVSRSADTGAVRAAYRRLMKECHPDQNSSRQAAERAREVAAAYAVFSHRERPAGFAWWVRPAAVPQARVRGRWLGVLLVAVSLGEVGLAVQRLKAPPVSTSTPDRRVEQIVEAPPVAPPPVLLASDEPVSPPQPEPESTPTTIEPTPARMLPVAPLVPTVVGPPAAPVDECDARPVCAAIDLAALERHLALLTRQSVQSADEPKRALLTATEESFRDRLERCSSATCRRDALLARNREIAEIMRG